MLAVLLHDEACARCLLDAGADPDIETPPYGTSGCPGVNAETQHWTALTYAALQGTCNIARLLLERGAHVEGGARLSEDKCTQTPLQVCLIYSISHDSYHPTIWNNRIFFIYFLNSTKVSLFINEHF